jgi:hypothetical protein
MRFRFVPILLSLSLPAAALCQTTQPATPPRLDYRASRAFDRGDYATALPLLQQLAAELASKPAKLAVVQERIRICQQQLAALPPQTQPAQRTAHQRPAPGQMLEITIKDLGNFDYDQDRGGNIPDDVKALDGCKVRLRGFMIPIDQAAHIRQFALVPSLFSCCFGQPPQIQHTIITTTPGGMAMEFSADEVIVQGTLSVSEKRDDGYIVSIFQVAADTIKSAPH